MYVTSLSLYIYMYRHIHTHIHTYTHTYTNRGGQSLLPRSALLIITGGNSCRDPGFLGFSKKQHWFLIGSLG